MSISSRFASLHCHSSHSPRDGLGRIPDMVAAVVADGQPALALTEHGNISGAWKLAKEAEASGIKSIVGEEVYLAIGSRSGENYEMVRRDSLDSDGAEGGSETSDAADGAGSESEPAAPALKPKTYEHLTVLAQNATGYRNLSVMNADAADHFWNKPRMDFDLLREHHDGLILLSGCASGPVAGALLRDGTRTRGGDIVDGMAEAEKGIEKLLSVFQGRDLAYIREHLFVEVMEHGIPAEQKITPKLFELAKRHGLQTVATNDSHYTRAQDHDAHDMWLCIGSSTPKRTYKISDADRWKFSGSGFHMRSYAEMAAAMSRYGDPGLAAVHQSVTIAESIDPDVLPESRLRLPQFPVPAGFDSAKAYLRHLVKQGAMLRYGADYETARPDVQDRLAYEFKVICRMSFADYFLIVHDVVSWARSNGIRTGAGRGSAAGSAVSYCLGIVAVEPISTGLLFERFLDDTREEMPDIDLDFDTAGQARVFSYLTQRWGSDRVARLGTFGFTRARAAIKGAARVMLAGDRATKVGNGLASLVPGAFTTLTQIADPKFPDGAALRDKLGASTEAQQVFDAARTIEAVISNEGVHACGVVISPDPLAPMVPLRRDRRKGREGGWVTQWDGKDVADLGLLKLDVLGLRNLDIVTSALAQIESTTGEVIDADLLPIDNSDPRVKATWAMLSAGRTAGVFQLEGGGIKRLTEQLHPSNLEDLSALVALYRPGPLSAGFHEAYARRKNGLEEVDYTIFSDLPGEQGVLQSLLDNTFGLIVYQEQLMQLGTAVAGFGPAENNQLRRAVSKKKKEALAEVGKLFMAGAVKEKIDPDTGVTVKIAFRGSTAARVWDGMKGAGDYSFNKAHSYAYGTLTYVTAFLKANWPAQLAAATLACTDDDDRRAATLASLRAEGFEVLAPSINDGQVATSCGRDLKIRLGLAEIKEVGAEVAAAIVADRDIVGGRYESLADLIGRVQVPSDDETKDLSVTHLVALIESGACDEFGTRMGMIMALGALRQHPTTPIPDADFGCVERTSRERARLGTIVSESPLRAARRDVAAWRTPIEGRQPTQIHRLPDADNTEVVTLGVLSALDLRSYSGGRMAKLTLDGSRESLEGIMFDSVVSRLERTGSIPRVGDVVALRGRLRTREVLPPAKDEDDSEQTEQPAEPEYRREIMVNDIYPVQIPDDGFLDLPAPRTNVISLIEVAKAKAAQARQLDAEQAAAKAALKTNGRPVSRSNPAPAPTGQDAMFDAPTDADSGLGRPQGSGDSAGEDSATGGCAFRNTSAGLDAEPSRSAQHVEPSCDQAEQEIVVHVLTAAHGKPLHSQLGRHRRALVDLFPGAAVDSAATGNDPATKVCFADLAVGGHTELVPSVSASGYLLVIAGPPDTQICLNKTSVPLAVAQAGAAAFLAHLSGAGRAAA